MLKAGTLVLVKDYKIAPDHLKGEAEKFIGRKGYIEDVHSIRHKYDEEDTNKYSYIMYSIKGFKSARDIPFWFTRDDIQEIKEVKNGKN